MANYLVTTKHPKGWRDGTHTFRVAQSGPAHWTRDVPMFYAVAAGFGCSKDYFSPTDAIQGMCEDHACRVTHIEPMGE